MHPPKFATYGHSPLDSHGQYDHVLDAVDTILWHAISETVDTNYPDIKTFFRVVCEGWKVACVLPSPGPHPSLGPAATAFIEDVTEDVPSPPESKIAELEARLAALEFENREAARIAEDRDKAHAEAVRQHEERAARDQAERDHIEVARQEEIKKAAALAQQLANESRQRQQAENAAALALSKATRHARRSLIAEVERFSQSPQPSASTSSSQSTTTRHSLTSNAESQIGLDNTDDEDDETVALRWNGILGKLRVSLLTQEKDSVGSRSETGKQSWISLYLV